MNPISKALKSAGTGIKKGVSRVGKFLDKELVEPSRNVNRIQNAKMLDMSKKAKAGEFN